MKQLIEKYKEKIIILKVEFIGLESSIKIKCYRTFITELEDLQKTNDESKQIIKDHNCCTCDITRQVAGINGRFICTICNKPLYQL